MLVVRVLVELVWLGALTTGGGLASGQPQGHPRPEPHVVLEMLLDEPDPLQHIRDVIDASLLDLQQYERQG